MSDLFREVDEEIRQEQIITFLKRHGRTIVAVVVTAIVGLAGYNYWQAQVRGEREAESERFEAAAGLMADGEVAEATQGFSEIEDDTGRQGYGMLAGFRKADALAQSGDLDGAVAAYDTIATDSNVEGFYRDLARISAANLMVDTAAPEEIDERMLPLSGEDSNHRLSALELRAAAHFRAGNIETAQGLFKQISEEAPVTSGARLRAAQMLEILGPLDAAAAIDDSSAVSGGAPVGESDTAPE